VVLGAERDAGARVGLEIGQIDEVVGLGVRLRHIVLCAAFGIAAPMQRDRRRPGLRPAGTAVTVKVRDKRELPVQHIVVLFGEVGEGVTDRDVRLPDADGFRQLPQQRGDHLGRRVHVVHPASQRVGLGIHSVGGADEADEVDFDRDPLARLVADVALALGLVVVAEEGVPRRLVGGLARQIAKSLGHHLVDGRLIRVLVLPEMTIARSFPVGRVGIVHPNDPPGVNPSGDADRLIGRLGLGQQGSLGGDAQCHPDRRDADAYGGQRQGVSPAVQTRPGLAQGCYGGRNAEQPGDEAGRQWHRHPLAGIHRSRGLGHHADEEPGQRQQPGDR